MFDQSECMHNSDFVNVYSERIYTHLASNTVVHA